MINFRYHHNNYASFLDDFARVLNVQVENHKLVFPEEVATGYMREISLPNGLELLLSDFETHQDLLLERVDAEPGFYSLRFDEVSIADCCIVKMGDHVRQLCQYKRAGSLLRQTQQHIRVQARKGTSVRGIYLQFSREWLQSQLGLETESTLLQQYFALDEDLLTLELWDAEYRRLVNEILTLDDHPFASTALQNRVMLLIERFFTRLHYKLVEKKIVTRLSSQDLEGLTQAEETLMKDFSINPPTIGELARMAGMSPSKFKIAFKQLYGLPVYQYYLKFKMQKARDLLITGNYPVKKVGIMLGYSNLSHFANAFRKETGQLPSELLN